MPNLAPLWEGYRRLRDPCNALPVTRGTGVEPVVVAPFPQGVLQQRAELLLAGSWADVTPYVYARDAVTIVRGRADEESAVNAGSCRFTVDNRDGRWSTRNPAGAWYGTLGRNTGYRHSVNVGLSRLWFPGVPVAGDHASCPDTAALSIVGDLDLRVDCWNPSWRKSTNLLFKSVAVDPEDTSEVSYGLILGS